MSIVYALIFVIIALFILAYYTRRRFGILALALCAGALLSSLWAVPLAILIKRYGFEPGSLPLTSVVQVALILLPALFLLYGGQSYGKQLQRIVGAAFFALLAASFLITPLGNSLSPDEMGSYYLGLVTDNKPIIITVAVVYALIDIMIPRLPSKKDKKKK
ncbi:MAG: conserved rane protein of unknown function [Candidatus Saccharibacteria bacterium]|nr:conserved rane protein of unknown function [Candidatus Saccharibacteria bacterium]